MSHDWVALADAAADDVHARFGHRLMGLAGTWIGRLKPRPATTSATEFAAVRRWIGLPWSEWHYWWQAHYLDAIIDDAHRHLRVGDQEAAKRELGRARALLRGIRIRNFGRLPNYFFDDMAWLALASHRLVELSNRVEGRNGWLAPRAERTLRAQLHAGHDQVLGGGLYWSRKRDFKNTPATAPAALHLARCGQRQQATALVEWLRLRVFDPELGLYLDGIHLEAGGPRLDTRIFTYNQGPILGALLQLGHRTHLQQAAQLIEATATRLGDAAGGLRLEGGGDGGLFTGILCRYLALAATDQRLPQDVRQQAGTLVERTALGLRQMPPGELSTAVQRWMILSAAATVNRDH